MRLGVIVAALAAGGLAACSNYAADRYSVSADNVVALRALNAGKVKVGAFDSFEPGLKEIPCRLVGPIFAPNRETFAAFVRGALADELKIADAYDDAAPVELTGRLDALDLASMSAYWTIGLTVRSSNGRSVSVATKHTFESNFVGEIACQQASQALMPAVQDAIKALVSDPGFPALVDR